MSSARQKAFELLGRVEKDGAWSGRLLADGGGFSPEDISLIHFIVKTVIERKLTIDYNLSLYLKQPLKRLKPQVLTALRVGAAQILYGSGIPVSAAVNESVSLVKKNGCAFASGLVNAVLRRVSENGSKLPPEDSPDHLSVKYSLSPAICDILIRDHGREAAEQIMDRFFGEPVLYVRRNTLKNDPLSEKYTLTPVPECLIPDDRKLSHSRDIADGKVHAQDLSSQLCCGVLAPEAGETVLDVCAAPGGKTCTLAEMMNDSGSIVACDIHGHKLRLIQENTARLGITCIQTLKRDASAEDISLPAADRILCDVPCSGLGVAGKKPEIRYRTAEEISSLPELQFSILERSSVFLKRGGRLVYSTCTLNNDENDAVVRRFLDSHEDFYAEEIGAAILGARGIGVTVRPFDYGSDGFYFASLRKL